MSRVNRWISVTLAAVWFIAIAPSAALAQTVTRGPYLQTGTPTSVVVRWRTDVATNSRVSYGSAPGSLTSAVDDPTSKTEHEVTLSGLTADTKYFYAVGTTTGILAGNNASHFVLTAPTPGTPKPTRVWVLGDSGTANASAAAVRDAYFNFTGTRHTDLWLMLGDNAYNSGTDAEYQAAVFNMYPTMLRKSVLWPTLGNHDGASANSATQSGPYYDIFTLPRDGEAGGVASGTEAFYSFDYGNIHFIVLDSFETDRSSNGAMMTWLRTDLAATRQDWIIAYWHHPPYSKGSHDSDTEVELVQMRQNALPILEAGGVDLVLAGHSHSYERSFLIDGHYGTSTTLTTSMILDHGDGRPTGNGAYQKIEGPHLGAVYTVAGSSGQTGGGSLNHPVMFISLNVLGSLVLDVNGNSLDATFLDSTGVIRDTFTVLKGGAPVPGNNPPVANNDSASTNEDTPVTINVLANDSDPDGDLLGVASVAAPGHGTAVINADKTVTYTPAPSFFGTDSFTYTASDGRGGSSTATVTVTVTAVNDPPVAENQSVTTPQGTAVAITLQATDPDGDPLTFRVVNGPANGVLSGTPPNVTYTPNQGFTGADSFTFNASDAQSTSNLATVSITVALTAKIVHEESQIGGSTRALTVTTAASLTGVSGHLYLAAISTKPHVGVTGVSGLGLTWTLVQAQCSGRNQTSVEVWTAQGTPSANGTVTATLAKVPSNAVIAVSRYSGAAAIGSVVSGNTLGLNGACSGGRDTNAYSFNLGTTVNGAVVYGAVATRHLTHTPGAGYLERAEVHQGSGGKTAGVAVEDKDVAAPATVTLEGSFSGTVDWAVVAAEIKPQ